MMASDILTPNKDYNRMRNFLRLIFLNGCYSRKSFKKYKILSDKQYRNYTKILTEYFSDEYHNIRQYSRDSLHMNYEYYKTIENYLIDSYLTKSSSSNFISVYFLVLQILNQSSKPLKRSEITEKLYKIYGFDDNSEKDSYKDLSEISIYNYLKEFVYLDILNENENNEFYLNEDIFTNLSDEEIIELYDCVCFYSNATFPSTPGYYLKHSLKKYIEYIRKLELNDNNLFLHRFVPLHSVLDDDIVIDILKSINLSKKIKIDYHKFILQGSSYIDKKRKFEVYPIKVIFDLKLGRWYLASLDDNNNLCIFRIDRIHSIKNLNDKFSYEEGEKHFNEQFNNVWTASIPFENKRKNEIKLQIHESKGYIIERIMSEAKNGQLILGEDDYYYFTLQIKDELELLPWIRTLSPHVKIIENDNLKNRFINDLTEMKNNYETI